MTDRTPRRSEVDRGGGFAGRHPDTRPALGSRASRLGFTPGLARSARGKGSVQPPRRERSPSMDASRPTSSARCLANSALSPADRPWVRARSHEFRTSGSLRRASLGCPVVLILLVTASGIAAPPATHHVRVAATRRRPARSAGRLALPHADAARAFAGRSPGVLLTRLHVGLPGHCGLGPAARPPPHGRSFASAHAICSAVVSPGTGFFRRSSRARRRISVRRLGRYSSCSTETLMCRCAPTAWCWWVWPWTFTMSLGTSASGTCVTTSTGSPASLNAK